MSYKCANIPDYSLCKNKKIKKMLFSIHFGLVKIKINAKIPPAIDQPMAR